MPIRVCFFAKRTRDAASLARYRKSHRLKPVLHRPVALAGIMNKIAAAKRARAVLQPVVQLRRSSRKRGKGLFGNIPSLTRSGTGLFGNIASDLARYVPF